MTAAGGRVLAIDPGEVRIGLALSDRLGITARPLEALNSVGPRKDVARMKDLIREHDVKRVVVGLPLLLSGEEGPAAAGSRKLAERLRESLHGIDVDLWDERLSTTEAQRTLIAADVSRRKRKQVVDSLAAVLILRSYLDARSAHDTPAP